MFEKLRFSGLLRVFTNPRKDRLQGPGTGNPEPSTWLLVPLLLATSLLSSAYSADTGFGGAAAAATSSPSSPSRAAGGGGRVVHPEEAIPTLPVVGARLILLGDMPKPSKHHLVYERHVADVLAIEEAILRKGGGHAMYIHSREKPTDHLEALGMMCEHIAGVFFLRVNEDFRTFTRLLGLGADRFRSLSPRWNTVESIRATFPEFGLSEDTLGAILVGDEGVSTRLPPIKGMDEVEGALSESMRQFLLPRHGLGPLCALLDFHAYRSWNPQGEYDLDERTHDALSKTTPVDMPPFLKEAFERIFKREFNRRVLQAMADRIGSLRLTPEQRAEKRDIDARIRAEQERIRAERERIQAEERAREAERRATAEREAAEREAVERARAEILRRRPPEGYNVEGDKVYDRDWNEIGKIDEFSFL